MLGSAWDWLVGLLAASPDGLPTPKAGDMGPLKVGGGGPWLDGDWDEADETAMVECILAEDDDTYLDSLLMLPAEQCGADRDSDDDFPQTRPKSHSSQSPGPCPAMAGRKRGAWASAAAKHRQSDSQCAASTWQSLGLVAASAFKLAADVPPPPPLELDKTPPPPRNRSVKTNLDAVVCQTSKEEEGCSPWQAEVPPRQTTASIPQLLFEGFAVRDSLLPPQSHAHKGKRTLVLDLDETLVHSVFQPVSSADFTLKVQLDQGPLDVFVLKRPGVDKFIKIMAAHYEIVVFTASVREYADPLLDILDPEGLVAHRLFRDACSNSRNGYVKDLTRLGRNLADIIIVDNSPHAYAFQPDNALPILSYYDDANDSELQKISPFLESLGSIPGDVRQLLTAALGAKVKSLMQSRLSFLL